ncbi:MAG: 50S ribosomal protein L4 [Bacteroidales bacterium]
MELIVKDIKGKDTEKKVTLDDLIFGIEPNEHAVYLDVKTILAHKRQGTHSSKERNSISGSTAKIKRQKGTGGARAGSLKNPLFRGGGRVFGPQPRNYDLKVNKKLKLLARKSVLSDKAKNNKIVVLQDFDFEEPKTKKLVDLKENLQISNKKVVLVLSNTNKNVYLSSRNLQNFQVVKASDINTYDLMKAGVLVLVESSISEIERILKK